MKLFSDASNPSDIYNAIYYFKLYNLDIKDFPEIYHKVEKFKNSIISALLSNIKKNPGGKNNSWMDAKGGGATSEWILARIQDLYSISIKWPELSMIEKKHKY